MSSINNNPKVTPKKSNNEKTYAKCMLRSSQMLTKRISDDMNEKTDLQNVNNKDNSQSSSSMSETESVSLNPGSARKKFSRRFSVTKSLISMQGYSEPTSAFVTSYN